MSGSLQRHIWQQLPKGKEWRGGEWGTAAFPHNLCEAEAGHRTAASMRGGSVHHNGPPGISADRHGAAPSAGGLKLKTCMGAAGKRLGRRGPKACPTPAVNALRDSGPGLSKDAAVCLFFLGYS